MIGASSRLRAAWPLAVLLTPLLCLGCAQVGPPLPPSANLPAAAASFRARRAGPWLELKWKAPAETEDGLRQRGAITPWLCIWPGGGQAAPPADAPCPRRLRVGAAQPPGAPGQARIGLERLAIRLPGVPPVAATAPRVLHVALVFANASGHWGARTPFRLAPAAEVAPAPAWLPARVLRAGIDLHWRPVAPSRVRIERRCVTCSQASTTPGPAAQAAGGAWRAVADTPAGTTQFLDGQIAWGQTYAYRLVSLAGYGREEVTSLPSAVLRVPARNNFAPGRPTGLESVATPPTAPGGAYTVALSWLPPPPAPPATVAGFNVYRRVAGGAWRRRNSALLLTPVFSDAVRAAAGASFDYAVSAVAANGIEGGKSAPLRVRLPPAQP